MLRDADNRQGGVVTLLLPVLKGGVSVACEFP